MTQRDRDRLVVLKKAPRKLITQQQAAVELAVTIWSKSSCPGGISI